MRAVICVRMGTALPTRDIYELRVGQCMGEDGRLLSHFLELFTEVPKNVHMAVAAGSPHGSQTE